MCIEYKPGRTNLVADALSRKAELVSLKLQKITAVSRSTLSDRIKEGLQYDTVARSLLQAVKEEKHRFWEKDGLLYTKEKNLFVPRWDNIRMDLLKECHDTRRARHPGQHRTMALFGTRFYWPQMKEYVESDVQPCLVCQQYKIKQKKPGGELDPLLILTRPSKSYYEFNLLLAQGGWAWKHHGGGRYIFKVCRLHGGICRLHCGWGRTLVYEERG